MKKKPLSLNQILIRILIVVLILFIIIGVIYVMTIKHYNKPNNNAAITSESIDIMPSTAATSSTSTLKTISGNSAEISTTSDTNTTATFKTSIADNTTAESNIIAELSIAEKATEKYKTEIKDADYSYITDSTMITITKYTSPDVYWLAHIIVNSPSQFTTALTNDNLSNRKTIAENEKANGWILGINASCFDNAGTMQSGLYIKDKNILQNTDTGHANGYEMCITANGKLFTADNKTSSKKLLDNGVNNTIISKLPTLIADGKKLEIDYNNKGPKTAIGQVSANEYYMFVASNGDWNSSISFKDIQTIFAKQNCIYAKMLDGSTNTAMMMNNKMINSPAAGNNRKLKDFIVIYDK